MFVVLIFKNDRRIPKIRTLQYKHSARKGMEDMSSESLLDPSRWFQLIQDDDTDPRSDEVRPSPSPIGGGELVGTAPERFTPQEQDLLRRVGGRAIGRGGPRPSENTGIHFN